MSCCPAASSRYAHERVMSVNGRLDAGGVAQNFFDVVSYTDAGRITLSPMPGNVTLGRRGWSMWPRQPLAEMRARSS
jgi:hypothetical protein